MRLLQPRENIKHKPQEGTVATAAPALIKQRCFCPAETSGRSYAVAGTLKRHLVSGNMDGRFGLLCTCSQVVLNQGFDNIGHYFGIQDFEALLLRFIRSKMIEILGCLKEARGELNNGETA